MDIAFAKPAEAGRDLPLVNFNVISTGDVNEVHAHMCSAMCNHDLTVTGRNSSVAFRHNRAALSRVAFSATDYGDHYDSVDVLIPPNESLYLFQYSLAGRAAITQNDETFTVSPGQLCVFGPHDEVRQSLLPGYVHFTVKIDKDDLEQALFQELGKIRPDLTFSRGAMDIRGEVRALTNLVRSICTDLDEEPDAYGSQRSRDAIEHALKHLILSAIPHNYFEDYHGIRSPAAPYYVRKVEEFIHSHCSDAITMQDMAEISGVSPRSLHAGFQRFRNTTPMRYLKEVRLKQARDLLLKPTSADVAVTDVALDCGFSHLSKFAQDYKALFGELPSQTLARGRG